MSSLELFIRDVPIGDGSNMSDCNRTMPQHHYMTFLTMMSSCFSMVGSALIIVTFVIWKDIRTVARAIVVFLSIADFFTATGYLFGAIVNYLNQQKQLGHVEYRHLCRAQSFVTTAFPISSFLWTSHLATYLYVAIVNANPALAKKLVIVFHITGWGIPLAICLPALLTGHLGVSNDQTSVNWCFVSFNGTNDDHLKKRLAEYYGFEFLCGKFWEIATSIVAVFLYFSVKIVLRKRRMNRPAPVVKSVAYGSLNMERKITAAMVYLDHKLIFIPLVFILLRFWGTLRFFISFARSCHTPCDDHLIVTEPCKSALYNPFLMVMQAICDPGQGWGNALIFVIFHKTLARRLCPCVFFIADKFKKRYPDMSQHRPSLSKNRIKDPLLQVEETDGHHTPLLSDEPTDYEKKRPARAHISTQ